MNTKKVIIPVENDTRIDISRITPETQGIILVKNIDDDCIGFISYNGDLQQWEFYNEGDTAIAAESGSTLLDCVTNAINNWNTDTFEFIEFA